MKKLAFAFFVSSGFHLASAQTLNLDKSDIDYGTITQGADGIRYFKVTNTGDKPLVIDRVLAGCGCTTPEWSNQPIPPGESSEIKVGYNTQIVGPFTKTIEINSNDPLNGRKVVQIRGVVKQSSTSPVSSVSSDNQENRKMIEEPNLDVTKEYPMKTEKRKSFLKKRNKNK